MTSASFAKETANSTIKTIQTGEIPFLVVISTSVAMVLSIFVLLLVICTCKRTQCQHPTPERSSSSITETKNEYETSIMMENPKINESTESLARTSSIMDLWKRIWEDDNYQPVYTPSTGAPLAAVLQITND